MKGFVGNIEKETLENNNFRRVLFTTTHSQLVLMSLLPQEEIGLEVHPDNDQFIRFEKGSGKCLIDGIEHEISDGSAIIVPAGIYHNVINTSVDQRLQLYTLYSPPHHRDGVIYKTKHEAEKSEEHFDGKTTN